ncbi:MAG: sulfatase [Armatimonadota bacterium]|jgi:choline-sulfatase
MPRRERAQFDDSRPNIVHIHAESMDGRKMGCMGDPALQGLTPNLDSLAEDGVLFTNAYSTCPVCNPSRASMFSGKYPHYYDCWNNHEGLREGTPILRDALNAAGYQTAMIGPLDYTWGKHSIRDQVGSWTRSANILRPISRTPLPEVTADDAPYRRDWDWTWQACEWIREASRHDSPFSCYLTTALVHPAFRAARRHMDMIDPDSIEMPPDIGPVGDDDHPVMRYIRITKNCDKGLSEAMVRQIRHVYYAMIIALDEVVGRVLDTLDDLGLRDNTYVVFSSDHGEMCGEQNQILKRTMFESSIHEPLIVTGPDVRRGASVDTPVSLIDLYPTFMDMARTRYEEHALTDAWPGALDGESLMPQLAGDAPRSRDWAFAEYNGDRVNTGTYMLRRGQWKYIKHVGYEPRLYDLEADPWEIDDVASTRTEVVAEMEGALRANFDCGAIDDRAKAYDLECFTAWREKTLADGTYRDTMAHIYSGFDRQCIEDVMSWTDENEAQIEAWLERGN